MKNQKKSHWADEIAQRIVKQKGKKEVYVLASGITPSGTVHIGNFRELVTVDFVRRALEDMGEKVRFLFFWDDYDVFRKVPLNMPKQELLKSHLGKPICEVPDVFEEEKSYARYHEKKMEEVILKLDIKPTFVYQYEKYKNNFYVKEIKQALSKRKEITGILNQYRREPLGKDWVPVSIFCEKCLRNEVKIRLGAREGEIEIKCKECGYTNKGVNEKQKGIKLLWRVDWPMRWKRWGVDFESGGKDHSSEGGSYDTAKEIARKVFGYEAPVYLMYDFVRIKGRGGKISSSKGEVVTVEESLEVYEGQVLRYLFASYRANVEFAISFDLDVLKIYEDFDRMEKKYYGKEVVSEKLYGKIKRIYELSCLEERKEKIPFRASFRHLCNIIQINEGEWNSVLNYYKKELKQESDLVFLKERFECALNWIEKYAPKEFLFKLNKEKREVSGLKASKEYIKALKEVRGWIENGGGEVNEKEISKFLYEMIKKHSLESKIFFKFFYQILINRNDGPKLASFIKQIGEKILKLI